MKELGITSLDIVADSEVTLKSRDIGSIKLFINKNDGDDLNDGDDSDDNAKKNEGVYSNEGAYSVREKTKTNK